MTVNDTSHFADELETARKSLLETGRNVEVSDAVQTNGEDGISCDFELPYSTLPRIRTDRWR